MHPETTMDRPELPSNETARIAAMGRMGLIGFERDERCQRYARIAAKVFQAPIAAVSILGPSDQWFRGCEGLASQGTARAISFCGHAIHEPRIFEVQDATLDSRFADNPLVVGEPYVRYYAGCPIRIPGELAVGALCIIDRVPRRLAPEQMMLLRDLADCLQSEMSTLLSVSDMDTVAKELFQLLPSSGT
ncbi:hypothetical protein GCM10008101_07980 [Lysobacter xinjiangensis]|uniref:GAF domain-containing protein n=2 Tax=Cognatilysobacter xinjiangensis TaxID=546892 RepID=A0ABQ3BWL4_9GAMM|nr:hypothetical protein GCM10008101_07980 [Lysobacter xinjiangensis]